MRVNVLHTCAAIGGDHCFLMVACGCGVWRGTPVAALGVVVGTVDEDWLGVGKHLALTEGYLTNIASTQRGEKSEFGVDDVKPSDRCDTPGRWEKATAILLLIFVKLRRMKEEIKIIIKTKRIIKEKKIFEDEKGWTTILAIFPLLTNASDHFKRIIDDSLFVKASIFKYRRSRGAELVSVLFSTFFFRFSFLWVKEKKHALRKGELCSHWLGGRREVAEAVARTCRTSML